MKLLEEIRKYELEGLLIRSRSQWIENGEKPTKYFCSLEKRNYTNKTITKLVNTEGNVIVDQKLILNEIKDFYYNLYSSRYNTIEDCDCDAIFDDPLPKLTPEMKHDLESR